MNNPLKYTDPTGHFAGLISLIATVKGLISIGNTVSTAVASNTPKAPPTSSAKLPNNPVFQQPIAKSSGGSSGGGGGTSAPSRHSQPPSTQGAKDIYNFVIGDDIKTLKNPNSTVAQKTMAGISLAGNFIPVGKIAKAPKVVGAIKDVNKVFTPDQAALIKLSKEAQKKGVNPEDATTLLEWADEVGLDSRGPEVHPNRPYGKNPHIHIGPVDHIFIK